MSVPFALVFFFFFLARTQIFRLQGNKIYAPVESPARKEVLLLSGECLLNDVASKIKTDRK